MLNSKTVITKGIAAKIAENPVFAQEVTYYHGRYLLKDWGDISENDKALNDESVASGSGDIMGAYETCEGRIWIKTEHDRSVTTILFPDEN